jgi:hypothetical protein
MGFGGSLNTAGRSEKRGEEERKRGREDGDLDPHGCPSVKWSRLVTT